LDKEEFKARIWRFIESQGRVCINDVVDAIAGREINELGVYALCLELRKEGFLQAETEKQGGFFVLFLSAVPRQRRFF